MKVKNLVLIGIASTFMLSGCAGINLDPKNINDLKPNHKLASTKTENLGKVFYSGEEDIEVPNESFQFCWNGHCGKNGIWSSLGSQFTQYKGMHLRPKHKEYVNTNIPGNYEGTKEFKVAAIKALKKAKAEVQAAGGLSDKNKLEEIAHKIKITTNGDSSSGFSGFCIQPSDKGSSKVKLGDGKIFSVTEDYYFWDLKHCYAPLMEGGRIVGWNEYDQSACTLNAKTSYWVGMLGALKNVSCEEAKKRGYKGGSCHTTYEGIDGQSCWALGKYIPGKVNPRYAFTTPAEFVHLITVFDREFKKELQNK